MKTTSAKSKSAKLTTYADDIRSASREYNRILNQLDKEARADRCAGDICCGWDWPTLCAVKPEVAARLAELREVVKSSLRAMKSAGLNFSF
jgi:hypothetical protein